MAYRLALPARAERDIDEFLERLETHSPETAARHRADLFRSIDSHVLERPNTWGYFYLTGRPYRGYLHNVSRRTAYWLVYSVDDDEQLVKVARFWNCARDPESFDI